MDSVDLTGVTSGGQWVDPTGLGTGPLEYVPAGVDPSGMNWMQWGDAGMPFNLDIPGLELKSTSPLGYTNPAPEGTYWVDAAGNIVANDGSIVIPASELQAGLGGTLDLGGLGVGAPVIPLEPPMGPSFGIAAMGPPPAPAPA